MSTEKIIAESNFRWEQCPELEIHRKECQDLATRLLEFSLRRTPTGQVIEPVEWTIDDPIRKEEDIKRRLGLNQNIKFQPEGWFHKWLVQQLPPIKQPPTKGPYYDRWNAVGIRRKDDQKYLRDAAVPIFNHYVATCNKRALDMRWNMLKTEDECKLLLEELEKKICLGQILTLEPKNWLHDWLLHLVHRNQKAKMREGRPALMDGAAKLQSE